MSVDRIRLPSLALPASTSYSLVSLNLVGVEGTKSPLSILVYTRSDFKVTAMISFIYQLAAMIGMMVDGVEQLPYGSLLGMTHHHRLSLFINLDCPPPAVLPLGSAGERKNYQQAIDRGKPTGTSCR